MLARVEAHAAAYGQCPRQVMRTMPLVELDLWQHGRRERLGTHGNDPTLAELDLLDELSALGSVEAYLAKHEGGAP